MVYNLNMDISFLKSNRFQALVVLAIVIWLNAHGFIDATLMEAFVVVLGGHISLKTIDRATERLGAGGA